MMISQDLVTMKTIQNIITKKYLASSTGAEIAWTLERVVHLRVDSLIVWV